MSKESRKLRAIRRLIWADCDFAAARDLAHLMVEESEIRFERPCGRAIETGIIVSYARPFGENNGLGSLPDLFRHFEDRGYQIMHDGMLRSRDVMEAHTNLIVRNSIMKVDEQADVTAIEINVDERGGVTHSIVPPRLPEEYFGYFVKLIDFQIERVREEILRIGNELADKQGRRPGTYTLGIEFP